jgi:hypothetical protein
MKVNAIFHYSKSFKAFKQNFLYTELRYLLTKFELLAPLARDVRSWLEKSWRKNLKEGIKD